MTFEPYKCLTVQRGDLLANVHFVKDGEVYYGVYRGGDVVALYRKSIAAFMEGIDLALAEGGAVFSLLKEPFDIGNAHELQRQMAA